MSRASEPNITILAPETPSAVSGMFRSGFGLPPDLLDKAQRRLAVFAAVLAVNSVIAVIIAPPLWSRVGITDVSVIRPVQIAFLVLSVAMFLLARFGPRAHPRILDVGLAYEVGLCFFGSLGQAAMFYAWTGQVPITSLSHVIIVAYPLIIPSPPGRTLITAIAATASVPASFAVLNATGSAAIAAPSFIAPTVFAAFSASVAVIGSRIVHGLHRDVAKARELGSYKLEVLLGRGGMGEVWRARHRLLARPAAIKLVRAEALGGDAASQQTVLARFEREAQATASLRSPHTIELYDFGVSETGTFYYVMELLDGFDAAALVEKFGPMPAERAVHLLRQMCDSLGEAHAGGLVHRDIKPSNVYVCRYGRIPDFVKVLDFGLVKPREAAGAQLTADHVVSGTPAFMAPEQVMGDRDLDARSDLYAVGCVAYWLLTSHYVFDGGNAMQIMMRHAREAPVPPVQRTELPIPRELNELVLACLEKDPAARPQDADALSAALDGVPLDTAWTRERAQAWWERHRP